MQNITLDAARGSEYIRVFRINVLIALYNKWISHTLFNDFNSFLSVTIIFSFTLVHLSLTVAMFSAYFWKCQ